jgi:divalent metal cation (Fe/Co/Zn/Cd) transporter
MSLRRGFQLEWMTLGWNIVGVVVLAYLAIAASSIALAGFGLDSLIEIGASTVVLWELSGTGIVRQRLALRMIGIAFIALALYLTIQSTFALINEHRASSSVGGISWTAITAVVMFALAAGKNRVGRALDNPVLIAEGRVTLIDGFLAVAVLLGVTLDSVFGWWWADPVAGFVIVFYAIREAVHIFRNLP